MMLATFPVVELERKLQDTRHVAVSLRTNLYKAMLEHGVYMEGLHSADASHTAQNIMSSPMRNVPCLGIAYFSFVNQVAYPCFSHLQTTPWVPN